MKDRAVIFAPLLAFAVLVLVSFSGAMVDAVQSVSSNAFLSVSIIQFLVFLLPIAFYCGFCRIPFFSAVRFGKLEWNQVFFLLSISLCFFFGAATLKYLGFALFGGALSHTGSVISAALYTNNAPLVLLCFVLFPAVLEEVLFRGVLFLEYRPYGPLFSIPVCAILFSMAHFSLANFVFYLFAGLVFGAMVQITGSILPSILLHTVYNGLNLYFEEPFFNYLKQTKGSVVLLFFFAALFLLFLFLTVSNLEHLYARRARSVREGKKKALQAAKARELSKPEKPKSASMRFREVFLSPTFILTIALFLLRATGIV